MRAAVRSGGVVLVAGDFLRAIDLETGRVTWTTADELPGGHVNLALDEGTLVVCATAAGLARVSTFDVETGAAGWSQPLEYSASAPFPDGCAVTVMDGVVVASAGRVAYGFRSADGVSLWRFAASVDSFLPSFAPRPAQGDLVFSEGAVAHLLNLATGDEMSALACDSCAPDVRLSGTMRDGRILASAGNRQMLVFDFAKLSLTKSSEEMLVEALLPNDQILVRIGGARGSAWTRALIAPTGGETWRRLLPGEFVGIAGQVALYNGGGTLHAHDLADGLSRWGFFGRTGAFSVLNAIGLGSSVAVWTLPGDLLMLDTSNAGGGTGTCSPCAAFCSSQSDVGLCNAAGDGAWPRSSKITSLSCQTGDVCEDGACGPVRVTNPVTTNYSCSCSCTCELCVAKTDGIYEASTCVAVCPQTCASGTSTCGAWQGQATGVCTPIL